MKPDNPNIYGPEDKIKVIQPSQEILTQAKESGLRNIKITKTTSSTEYKDILPGDAASQNASLNAAYAKMGESLAKEARANWDYRTEGEQLGKYPLTRWFNHPLVGRSTDKGIADILFLSIFGHSSATDTKRTRFQRALLRIGFTMIVFGLLHFGYSLLLAS